MSQHLHSPTKLTEFARDFEEEPDTLFGRFVNKIQNAYNHSYNTMNDVPNGSKSTETKSIFYIDPNKQEASNDVTKSSPTTNLNVPKQISPNNLTVDTNFTNEELNIESSLGEIRESKEIDDKTQEMSLEISEGRTMVNVLKRISNIMASKNSDLRNYRETDLQRFWMPDSKAKECYDCSQKFSTFRRKHHCRLCGQIFCAKCCNQVVPGKIIMCSGDLKVCNYCSKIVLSYLKSPNITVDLHADLQALQQDLSNKLDDSGGTDDNNLAKSVSMKRKISVGYQEERFATYPQNNLSNAERKNILQQSNSLIALHEELQRTLSPQNCGTVLIEFLNRHNKSSNKVQAIAILSAMLAAGFLQPIVPDSEQTEFDENLHYKFAELQRSSHDQDVDSIIKTYNTNFSDISEASSPLLDKTQPPQTLDTSSHVSPSGGLENEVENSIRSTTIASKLLESYCEHEEQIVAQMLQKFKLDICWSKVLLSLCCRAANHFKPEYCTNDLMDIRNYVNFKKLPGGKRKECKIVGGVVFSKNVAHKDMATRVDRPRILLLQCPIMYERVEGKFVSISTVMLQEKEYLRNVTERIMSFQPNVILVHKNVAGIAQDMLRAKGITLVLDVKLSVMERLARTLQCDIVNSVESNIAKPKLGICDAFYIQSYNDGHGTSKTLMFFEKLSSPRGYTCLLRGGTNLELAKVKRVASFLVYARYNWRLEMSFLLDEFARPLSPQPSIFDSKDASPDENATSNRNLLKENEIQSSACPPIRSFNGRRLEEKIQTSTPENVADFSDPLRTIEISSDTSSIIELAVEMRYDNRFRNALTSTVLSVSPFLTFPLPYLETEQGRKCALRSFFPTELYYSKQLSVSSPASNIIHNLEHVEHQEAVKCLDETKLKPPHPFLTLKITAPIDNRDIQTLLAEFRAFGGRYPKKTCMFKLVSKFKDFYQLPQKVSEDHIFKDALDIENHQRLPVLFCSFYFNPQSPSFCAPPTLLDMKFYGQHDIMLGQFLHRYCCRLSSICTLCNLPMLGHVRRYVHYTGCVQVFLKEDNSKAHTNVIYFTAWCTLCNEMTPSVPLSEATKCLSFAKYLELRFHGHAYRKRALDDPDQEEPITTTLGCSAKCQHSLHRDYIHYFTYRGVGAKFVYTPIQLWEIELPKLVLDLQSPKPFNHFQVLEEIKSFSMRGHEIFTRIHERIADLATEDENSPLLISFKTTLSMDQFVFKQHVEIVQTLLTESKANYYDITDALLMARRILAASIEHWGPRLHDIAMTQKLASKQHQQHDNTGTTGSHIDAGTICTEDARNDSMDVVPISEVHENTSISEQSESNQVEYASSLSTGEVETVKNQQPNFDKKVILDQTLSSSTNASISADKKSIKQMLIHLLPSTHNANIMQSPFLPQEHYTLPLGIFPILVHDHDFSSIIAYSLTSHDYQRALQSCTSGVSEEVNGSLDNENTTGMSTNLPNALNSSPSAKRKSQENSHESDDNFKESTTSSHKTNSSPNTSSANAANSSKSSASNSTHIELAFQDSSTQFNCTIYFAKEFDLMRLRTLRPPKIGRSLYKELEESKKREELKVSQGRMGSSCSEIDIVRRSSEICQTTTTTPANQALNTNTKPVCSTEDSREKSSRDSREESDHLQAEMEECRIFLARSLCSSVQWEARGGKSGSRFCKTLDDRFVLKEMTKSDINIFENFAPNYFEYINKCQSQNQPTLLAKIFGVYKVTIKKKDFFMEKSLLVMENLFYDRDIKNKFDLKGSERNRLVEPSNQKGEEVVLLDENLMRMSWSKPLYVLSHSKTVLKDAIYRDSSFLERNEVMDYSLLVGLDNKKGVLVLGIIDYIRTFTLDKRIESIVKQTGLLGARGKLPTVIPPEPYKQRFTESMDRYFNAVPDRWEGLAKV